MTIEEALRRGFEIACEHAEISEDDGWHRCAPYIDWKVAEIALEKALAALDPADRQPAPDPAAED